MTGRTDQVTCYPGMGCSPDFHDCRTNPLCYTGPADAQYGTLLSDAQLERLGLSAADAAAAAEWARAYGDLTDEQRAHIRAICHPFANGG